jgi:hypothetical protein
VNLFDAVDAQRAQQRVVEDEALPAGDASAACRASASSNHSSLTASKPLASPDGTPADTGCPRSVTKFCTKRHAPGTSRPAFEWASSQRPRRPSGAAPARRVDSHRSLAGPGVPGMSSSDSSTRMVMPPWNFGMSCLHAAYSGDASEISMCRTLSKDSCETPSTDCAGESGASKMRSSRWFWR